MGVFDDLKTRVNRVGTDSGGDFEFQFDLASAVGRNRFTDVFKGSLADVDWGHPKLAVEEAKLMLNGETVDRLDPNNRTEFIESIDQELGTGARIYTEVHDPEVKDVLGKDKFGDLTLKTTVGGETRNIDVGKIKYLGDDNTKFVPGSFQAIPQAVTDTGEKAKEKAEEAVEAAKTGTLSASMILFAVAGLGLLYGLVKR